MLAHAQALAGEIGPRGTGTPGEEAAAAYVAERLSALGLPVERQSFRAVASQNAFPLAISLLTLLAVAIYPWGGTLGRWVAAALAMSTAPLLWHTIRTSNNPLRPFLPKVTSRNVLTRIEPQGELLERVVILAHLDTNRCRLAWQSSVARALEPLTYLTLAMLASLGALYLVGALLAGSQRVAFGGGWLWVVSLIPAAYVVGMIITLLKDDRTAFSPGAHDNAASVAVALELGARLVARPLERTQVWLVFTGAEETDHAGLYTLLRCYGAALRQAAFIGLEGLGSGELVYLSRQGLCAHYRPDAGLHALAAGVAARLPELGARAAQMTMEDEVGTLRRAGYRAIGIAGRDPATGTLPHWHRPDDTVDTLSVQFMHRAASFITALLEQLDGDGAPPTGR
jgi:acetylornithine deacetylase/succinyl-diaminopimelate desuccinylase-like protein